MNDISEKISCDHITPGIPAMRMTIRGHEDSQFSLNDILMFCQAKGILPEYLVAELIKELEPHYYVIYKNDN